MKTSWSCREHDCYLAQSLEYDIAAHGDTPEQATRAFALALMRHRVASAALNRPLFADVPKAPERYWQMWQASKDSGATGCCDAFHCAPFHVFARRH